MVKYGLVLGGGGSRGAYEMGVWRAARELGITFDVITGTSIGAMNGALIIQGDYDFAKEMWEKMSYNSVMTNLTADELTTLDGARKAFRSAVKEIVSDGGMDIAPLENLVRTYIKEETIRNSPVEFGFVTVEIPSLKEVEMTKENIPQGELADYILASAACYPAFKPRAIGEYRFVDGGYRNNLPIDLAIELGAQEIWAVDLQALGYIPEKLMYDIPVRYIRSYWDLGIFLAFDESRIKRNMELGYLDTMKSMGKIDGFAYAFQNGEVGKNESRYMKKCTELMGKLGVLGENSTTALGLAMNKRIAMTVKLGKRRRNSEQSDFLRYAELAAEEIEIDPTKIYTFEELNKLIVNGFGSEESISAKEIEETMRTASGNLGSVAAVAKKISRISNEEKLSYIYNAIGECLDGARQVSNMQMIGTVLPREFVAAVYIYMLINDDK